MANTGFFVSYENNTAKVNMSVSIRRAERGDASLILDFIHRLAEYEREPEAVKATEGDILRDGFGDAPLFCCLIAEYGGVPVGFALYFTNYSTWEGRGGIYLEDLFVLPDYRGLGAGEALLRRIAAEAVEKGFTRLVWNVLKWNTPAIEFYKKIGARDMDEWSIFRLEGENLQRFGL